MEALDCMAYLVTDVAELTGVLLESRFGQRAVDHHLAIVIKPIEPVPYSLRKDTSTLKWKPRELL